MIENLNPQQLAAVENVSVPMLVLAGAGSGKTRVIVEKIFRLISSGVPADSIYAVTFTRKAAAEMKDRLGVPAVRVSTFHHLSARILLDAGVKIDFQNSESFDFDGLISSAVSLLLARSDVLQVWRDRINHLLIDEFQDTDSAQYDLFRLLVGDSPFTVVGDDDQSIYAWRGACPENMNRLLQDFPDLRLVKLEQNHRSTSAILSVAAASIAQNPRLFQKRIYSDLCSTNKPLVFQCSSEKNEAAQLVREIRSAVSAGVNLGDCAVLYRSDWMADVVRAALSDAGIPFSDSAAENQLDLFQSADSIRLSTIHSAKGLEWDHVFILGCERDLFPLSGAVLSEERCLFYVAVTRARRTLSFFHCSRRLRFGGFVPAEISPFLSEISSGLFEWKNLESEKMDAVKFHAFARMEKMRMKRIKP